MPKVLDPAAIYPRVVSKSVDSLTALRSALARGAVPDHFGRHLGNVISGADDIARIAYRKVRRELSRRLPTSRIHGFRLAHMTEQVPNPDSRVTLGTERDSLGQTRVRLDWRLSPIDILSVVRTQTIVDSRASSSGAGTPLHRAPGRNATVRASPIGSPRRLSPYGNNPHAPRPPPGGCRS